MSGSLKGPIMIEQELKLLIQENENLYKQRDSLQEKCATLRVLVSEAYRVIKNKHQYGHDWERWLQDASKALESMQAKPK